MGYILVYRKHKHPEIEHIQETLLKKLIENGLKLKLSNFLIIDMETSQMRFSSIKDDAKPQKVILMGVSEQEFGLNINLQSYQLTMLSGIHFIKCDSPEKLNDSNALKTALWKQLQQSFNPEA